MKKRLKSIEMVKQMVYDSMQGNEYFYSGDKDTRIESINEVFKKYNIGEYYKLDKDTISKNVELYKDEIDKTFNDMVKGYTELDDFYEKVIKFLDMKIEEVKINENYYKQINSLSYKLKIKINSIKRLLSKKYNSDDFFDEE